MKEEPIELQKELHWWAVLDDVPHEVVRVLVFLVSWAGDIREAFRRCDTNCDGALNHKEFVSQLAQAGCLRLTSSKKRKNDRRETPYDKDKEGAGKEEDAREVAASQAGFGGARAEPAKSPSKTPASPSNKANAAKEPLSVTAKESTGGHVEETKEQIDALTLVYRFLDTTTDGDISKKEFEILESIWRELWQSSWELKNHLEERFGSLTEAFEVAVKEDDDHMLLNELEKLASEQHFHGPVKQIFMYLDADQDEKISLEEWLHLEKLGGEIKQPKW